ncbi:hypothetical protein L227DRAFT_612588 [Lentinus tigrinus ALCF2SS1-6]|uniref:Uncharacterized protein n=1 Tax=Lentinus tigrinus ALCF2SS1-6 TaxID=1328759 RepID=A0A5C2S6Z7_9APHY|nr:hypothetical protein L227DRAFT_612588 [Lentinus tigrinus ALCF2SS1-6]
MRNLGPVVSHRLAAYPLYPSLYEEEEEEEEEQREEEEEEEEGAAARLRVRLRRPGKEASQRFARPSSLDDWEAAAAAWDADADGVDAARSSSGRLHWLSLIVHTTMAYDWSMAITSGRRSELGGAASCERTSRQRSREDEGAFRVAEPHMATCDMRRITCSACLTVWLRRASVHVLGACRPPSWVSESQGGHRVPVQNRLWELGAWTA